jgi:hypothetical protein
MSASGNSVGAKRETERPITTTLADVRSAAAFRKEAFDHVVGCARRTMVGMKRTYAIVPASILNRRGSCTGSFGQVCACTI